MRHKRAAWTLLGVATVVACITALWNASDLGRASRSLAAQKAAARREGVPMEWEDIYRLTPAVPVADNAAVAYARGFAAFGKAGRLKGIDVERLPDEIAAGAAKAEDLAKLRATLTALEPALEEVKEGSLRKGFSFDRNWEKGFDLLFPEYSDARGVGRALALRALLAKDPAAARDDLTTAARLRAHIGSEPVMIAALVGTAMENDVHRAVRIIGRRGGAWAGAMEPVLAELGPVPDLRHSLASESVSAMHLTEMIAKLGPNAFSAAGGSDSSSEPTILRLSRFGPVRDAFEARTVEYWRGVYAKLPKDSLDWRATAAAVRYPWSSTKGPSYALLEIATPVLDGLAPLAAQLEAQRRLSHAALELWQGRPSTLADDPFGKGALKLRRQGNAWTLWSVGPDGVDGGGKARVKPSQTKYDLVVGSEGGK